MERNQRATDHSLVTVRGVPVHIPCLHGLVQSGHTMIGSNLSDVLLSRLQRFANGFELVFNGGMSPAIDQSAALSLTCAFGG